MSLQLIQITWTQKFNCLQHDHKRTFFRKLPGYLWIFIITTSLVFAIAYNVIIHVGYTPSTVYPGYPNWGLSNSVINQTNKILLIFMNFIVIYKWWPSCYVICISTACATCFLHTNSIHACVMLVRAATFLGWLPQDSAGKAQACWGHLLAKCSTPLQWMVAPLLHSLPWAVSGLILQGWPLFPRLFLKRVHPFGIVVSEVWFVHAGVWAWLPQNLAFTSSSSNSPSVPATFRLISGLSPATD